MPESRREIEELLAEAKYYLVQGLLEECQAALQVGTPSLLEPSSELGGPGSSQTVQMHPESLCVTPVWGRVLLFLSTDLRGSL